MNRIDSFTPAGQALELPSSLNWRHGQCDIHGPYKTISPHAADSKIICPHCAFIDLERRRREDEYNTHVLHNFKHSQIPARYAGCKISGYLTKHEGQKAARQTVIEYLRDWPTRAKAGAGLVLFGHHGTGKTHLACALLSNLIAKGYSGRYFTARDMLDYTIEGIKVEGLTYQGQINKIATLDLLIIDEIDAIAGEKEISRLSQIIERRHRDLKPTLAISNTDLDVLHTVIGKRAVDRLIERASFAKFDWESERALD